MKEEGIVDPRTWRNNIYMHATGS